MSDDYGFPARTSNQITKGYYDFLVGEINKGTCTKKVQKALRRNGSYTYYTYHLLSVM